MTLKTAITADVATFFSTDEFASSATYVAGETVSSVTCVLEENADPSTVVEGMAASGVVHLKRSDVSDPKIYDQVIIGTTTWTVQQVMTQDDDVSTLAVTSDRRLNGRGA